MSPMMVRTRDGRRIMVIEFIAEQERVSHPLTPDKKKPFRKVTEEQLANGEAIN